MRLGVSGFFIRRPVATTLLTVGVAIAGALGYSQLPVSPLPQVDFPVISVSASMAGANPETMAATVASPLERHLGAIADVNEMTSSSSQGSARITLQFGLDRDINGAARDVQAAINAARADLPAALRANPTYRKVNPADAPIMVLALKSGTRRPGELYKLASNVLQQRLSQLDGVGQVDVEGSALPAVRVEVDPQALFHYGIGFEDVRAALASANANSPKGMIESGETRWQVYANDQATKADDYKDLVIAYRNHAAIRLQDVAQIVDSVEDLRNAGLAGGVPSIGLIISRQPGANIIDVVERVKAELPQLTAALPGDVDLDVVIDRSITIRTSLNDTQRTLLYAILLVVAVVFAFLRNVKASAIPAVAVPVSILGSFGVMYLLGYSLNNLSLMALTVATGFVVDDAIVVLENISRRLEMGETRTHAALNGAREVSFTVVSISLSLIAVFLPLLVFGGFLGRMFREFSMTLSVAVVISLLVSLTTTPAMCALILPRETSIRHGVMYRASELMFDAMLSAYRSSLLVALRHKWIVTMVFFGAIALNVSLFRSASYSLFPAQDTGLIIGSIQGDQSISFQAMKGKLAQLQQIVEADPAVLHAAGVTGGRQVNSGFVYVSLKPLTERKVGATAVVDRLRKQLAQVAGARLFLVAVSDLRVGGRQSNATYQYTLLSDDDQALAQWTPKLVDALQGSDVIKDLNSDQQSAGLEADVVIDRDAARQFGLTLSAIDNTLYDAFGQRQVSTIFDAQNQYHVVMEASGANLQDPGSLSIIDVSTSGSNPSGSQLTNAGAGLFSVSTSSAPTSATIAADSARNLATNSLAVSGHSSASAGAAVSTSQEKMIPLSSVARFTQGHSPTSVNHQGLFAAATISFNLAAGASLGAAQAEIEAATRRIGMPSTVHGVFAGTAATFAQSQSSLPLLIGLSLVTIYIVLGVLYESFVHPITILSTLPSASVGALLALQAAGLDFTIIAFIGVVLLIGIVKKNAIMMVDFALQAERAGAAPRQAIIEACLLRFRPIMMTTFAAMLGALPLIVGSGEGSELRQPLGVTIIGGLVVSQVLTLYTTPVIFLGLDAFGTWVRAVLRLRRANMLGGTAAST